MRYQFKLLACGFVAWGLMSGPSSANTVILDVLSGYSYEVESGAFVTQPGIGGFPSPDVGTPGGGPILGTGLLFALGTPDIADTSAPLCGGLVTSNCLSNIVGFVRDNSPFAFYFGGKASDIIAQDIQFTAIIGSTGNLYLIDFLSWHQDRGGCLDNDGGVSCAAAGGATSFNLDAAPVPLPAALPLFAGGLGGLGVMSWWRRRRAAA